MIDTILRKGTKIRLTAELIYAAEVASFALCCCPTHGPSWAMGDQVARRTCFVLVRELRHAAQIAFGEARNGGAHPKIAQAHFQALRRVFAQTSERAAKPARTSNSALPIFLIGVFDEEEYCPAPRRPVSARSHPRRRATVLARGGARISLI